MAKQLHKIQLDQHGGNTRYWDLWADDGIAVSIGLLKGVDRVDKSNIVGKQWTIWLDPRYDLTELAEEIIALVNQVSE